MPNFGGSRKPYKYGIGVMQKKRKIKSYVHEEISRNTKTVVPTRYNKNESAIS